MNELKLCVYCEHIQHSEGGCGSEWTGCWSGDYSCKCDHFRYESERFAFPELPGWTYRAMTCPDYELSHEVLKELGEKK